MTGADASLPADAVVILSTIGPSGPHAIPVSAARLAAPGLVLLALSGNRGSLTRLRDVPEVAVTIIETGLAKTLRGRARVASDALPGAEFMAVVAVAIDAIDDHLRPNTLIQSGVRWDWADRASSERHLAVMAALEAFELTDTP